MKVPKISVVMPVYNGEKYLEESITSVLNQTYANFEFIIINDASTDNSLKIIKSFRDKRIKLVNSKKNLGVAKSLNTGLKLAFGEYIARFDADDICYNKRLEKQKKFLDKNTEYVLVGSAAEIISDSGEYIGDTSSFNEDDIKRTIFLKNCLIHPSVMFRKDKVLEAGGYKDFFDGAEDYELWFRLLNRGKFFVIEEKLIKKRIHPMVVTKRKHIKVELLALLVRVLNLKHLPNILV